MAVSNEILETTKLLRLELLSLEQWNQLAESGMINRDALYLTPVIGPHIIVLDEQLMTQEDIENVPHNSIVFLKSAQAPSPPPDISEPEENDNGNG